MSHNPALDNCCKLLHELSELHHIKNQRIAQLEAELAEARKDGERYRYLRDVGFYTGTVNLGQRSDRSNYVEFVCRFQIPEMANELSYEEEEWTSEQINAAIDAAMGAK
jgi:hypothetical protein